MLATVHAGGTPSQGERVVSPPAPAYDGRASEPPGLRARLSGMAVTTRPASITELARRAGVLTIFPVVIGIVQSFMYIVDGQPWAALPGMLLSVALAAPVFFAAVLLPSAVLTRWNGERHALQLRVTCPACARSQLIINTQCIYCEEAIGVPPASRVTYLSCMAGLALFELTLALAPHRWLLD